MFAVKAKNYGVIYNQSSSIAFEIYCTARQCSPLRLKFMERSIINPALSLLVKRLVISQRQKFHIKANIDGPCSFSAFHWSPHGSLVPH